MPSFVTAPTVASTTTWGRTSRWSCFRYSTCPKIFTSLSSSRSEAFCKSTGAGGENRVGGGGVARHCSSTQPRSPFGINCTSWETRPSILCVTHQISRKKRNNSVGWTVPWDNELQVVLDGTGSVYDNTGWYLVSISWYCLILGGTWSAKGLYACIYWKKWRFGRVLPMPDTLTHRQKIELLSLSPV